MLDVQNVVGCSYCIWRTFGMTSLDWICGCDDTGISNITIDEWETLMMKSSMFLVDSFFFTHLKEHTRKQHTHASQRCLFTTTTPLTRGNNAECVKALHGERRTKPIFVSQLALPPDWAAPLCETSHRKTHPLRTQQATLMCKYMHKIFRKAEITELNGVAALKLLRLWVMTMCFFWNFPQFPGKQWL